jgi:hypothetical protein
MDLIAPEKSNDENGIMWSWQVYDLKPHEEEGTSQADFSCSLMVSSCKMALNKTGQSKPTGLGAPCASMTG